MKHTTIALRALLTLSAIAAALALRAAPLANDALVYSAPTTTAGITGTLAAGTMPPPVTSPATLALPAGWQAVERADAQDCWVRDNDLDKELNVKPGALLRAAANAGSVVTGTMAPGDTSDLRDIQGKWVQVRYTKRTIGYIQTETASLAPAPAPSAPATATATITVTAPAPAPATAPATATVPATATTPATVTAPAPATATTPATAPATVTATATAPATAPATVSISPETLAALLHPQPQSQPQSQISQSQNSPAATAATAVSTAPTPATSTATPATATSTATAAASSVAAATPPPMPRSFEGTLATTRRAFAPRRPYDYQLNDSTGGRFAYLDLTAATAAQRPETCEGQTVIIYGTMLPVPGTKDIVIKVETMQRK